MKISQQSRLIEVATTTITTTATTTTTILTGGLDLYTMYLY